MTPTRPDRARDKILTLRAAKQRVDAARARGETLVFTNGCFDLLHPGHVRSLEQARSLGDRLLVAINLDASVRRLKGPDRPIQTARVRMEIVAALACVDWVVGFASSEVSAFFERLRALRPDVLAKGGDWAEDAIVGASQVRGFGGRVVRLREVRGERTTRTLERIRQGTPRNKR